jgi:sodium transport system permease protein
MSFWRSKPWLVVLRKEVLESLRDRRTLLSALVLAPLLGPVMFSLSMQTALKRGVDDQDKPLEVAVIGAEHAPNLVRWLESNGLKQVPAPKDAAAIAAAVRDAKPRLVLAIDAAYAERFRAARPAGVKVYVDSSDQDSRRDYDRLERLLQGYAGQTAALRLAARGIDPAVMQAAVIDEIDVSTPASRAQSLLAILSYFLLFSTLIGGMYVAIDATAGERERGSLEPLVSLPVSREALVTGKFLATLAFSTLSLVLTMAAFTVSLRFVPLESIGMSANLGPSVVAGICLAVLPFVPLAAALLTLVASFARSFREAQSWMTGAMLVPTLPIMVAAMTGLKPSAALMAVPSLSQHFLIGRLLRDEAIPLRDVLYSAGGSLLLAGVLLAVVFALWRREKLLG